MIFNQLGKRKFEREYTNEVADYYLYSGSGKILNAGQCYIDNISKRGLGLRVNSPFFKEDNILICFIHKRKLYNCKGTITRDISWSQKTGMEINRVKHLKLD